jgi:hypothetical protein
MEKSMSTDYRTEETIAMADLFDGRLAEHGIDEKIVAEKTSETVRCLTDGRNWLWIYGKDSHVTCMTRRGLLNVPTKILTTIADTFATDIFSEHQPQYWGFETQQEWDLFMDKLAEEDQEKFYQDIVRFLNGESHDLTLGTIGMTKAEIARELIDIEPDLREPRRKADLLEKLEAVYDERHAVAIALDDNDLALLKLITTHEDDLASA